MEDRKKKVAITALVSASVIIEIIAMLLWLIPIVGFILYACMTGVAICLVVVSWFLSKNHRQVYILSGVLGCIYIVGMIVDISLIIMFVM